MLSVENKIYHLLKTNGYTITTAESCTGGMVASRLVNVDGVSACFKEGFVTYSDDAKNRHLGVPKSVLRKYTAVSATTAYHMANNIAKKTLSDVSVSVTGYAGYSDGLSEDEVGLVYIGCCLKGNTIVRCFKFSGDRQQVRQQACEEALKLVYNILKTDTDN